MQSKKGFVLIPDRRALTEAIELSKLIHNNELELDLTYRIPHVTVLQTYFLPGFDYKTALKTLRSYSGFNSEPQTKFGDIRTLSTHNHSEITWWNVAGAEWLTEFNRELIETFAPYIVKPTDSEQKSFESPAAKESYEITGYERNLGAYEPHITIAVGGKKNNPISSTLIGDRVRFHRLAFVEHGELGEIKNILASEDLPFSWDW